MGTTTTTVVTILLAVAALGSAVAKLRRVPAAVDPILAVGVPARRVPQLALLEIAGAVGLVAGLFWTPIGVAAAIGLVLYFLGAVVAHLRVGDRAVGPAAGLLVLSVVVLVLTLLSR